MERRQLPFIPGPDHKQRQRDIIRTIVIVCLFWLAFYGTVGVVACHFIRKAW